MGEYFTWVNVDKQEYISPSDFGCGNKFHETLHKDSCILLALHTLLSERWSGDYILFLGDECNVPEGTNNYVYELLVRQFKAYSESGYTWDMIFDTYRNVSGLFKEAENKVRPEICQFLEEQSVRGKYAHNEYGVNYDDPYKGLFVMTGRRRRYVLNQTRRFCYSLEKTKITYLGYTESVSTDPLPLLLGYGRSGDPGPWIGDLIGVSEEIPGGYTLLKDISIRW